MQYQVAQAAGTSNFTTISSPFVSSLSNALEENWSRERQTSPLKDESAMRLSAGPSLAPVTALAVPANFPSSSTTTTSSYMSEPWTPNQKGEIIMKLGPQEPCVDVDKPTVTRHHVSHFGGRRQAKRKYTKSGEKDEGQREKQQV
ncbi:hypothetical protein CVT24_011264 [Panaeolus cyanescens]|uniref:Uncharacterized protein n=1 Tax=Panaeolus cyanescens TaxID=181874 RepID=A0A409WWY3_9AGAR|nr:hypothetical protein CVT24_011264 [Panaeolus cyanescens]